MFRFVLVLILGTIYISQNSQNSEIAKYFPEKSNLKVAVRTETCVEPVCGCGSLKSSGNVTHVFRREFSIYKGFQDKKKKELTNDKEGGE